MKYITPANVKIGHVHLKVAKLDLSLKFYCDVLGFTIKQRVDDQVAFIAAGDYHHHIGLNTWESKNGTPPELGTTGLYHTAILYPTRKDLSNIYKRLIQYNIELTGASDHGVSEALYLNDPDKNGVELYWDKPQKLWPFDPEGHLKMFTKALDLDSLLSLSS
jgi:catechol 2,3-dioxygenase